VEFRQAVCKIFNVRYQRSHSRTDGQSVTEYHPTAF